MTESICKTDEYGNKYWWLNGMLHREDGPAIEYTDGAVSWYLNGQCYLRINKSGTKYWLLNEKLHREDGPAIERDGFIEWYLNDKFIAIGGRPKNWDELVLLAQVELVMES